MDFKTYLRGDINTLVSLPLHDIDVELDNRGCS